MSQPEFANHLRLTRDQLAGVENGRTPLKYAVAEKMGITFDVNQVWLAEEQMDMVPYLPPPPELLPLLDPKELFSMVYELHLRAVLLDYKRNDCLYGAIETLNQEAHRFAFLPEDSKSSILNLVLQGIREKYLQCPEASKSHLLRALVMAALRGGTANSKTFLLTVESEFRKTIPVQMLTLQQLLNKTRRLAKPAGVKAALAEYLGVPQSRVSEWLGGKYSPSGDIALRILAWVSDPARQQETLGRDISAPKGKTLKKGKVSETASPSTKSPKKP